jgi:hypothetical protein
MLFLILSWLIRLSGLFPFKINSEIVNLVGSRWDSLNGGSARRKSYAYTGQHKHRTNVDRPRYQYLDKGIVVPVLN